MDLATLVAHQVYGCAEHFGSDLVDEKAVVLLAESLYHQRE